MRLVILRVSIVFISFIHSFDRISYVAQVGAKLLGSSDCPVSASWLHVLASMPCSHIFLNYILQVAQCRSIQKVMAECSSSTPNVNVRIDSGACFSTSLWSFFYIYWALGLLHRACMSCVFGLLAIRWLGRGVILSVFNDKNDWG